MSLRNTNLTSVNTSRKESMLIALRRCTRKFMLPSVQIPQLRSLRNSLARNTRGEDNCWKPGKRFSMLISVVPLNQKLILTNSYLCSLIGTTRRSFPTRKGRLNWSRDWMLLTRWLMMKMTSESNVGKWCSIFVYFLEYMVFLFAVKLGT